MLTASKDTSGSVSQPRANPDPNQLRRLSLAEIIQVSESLRGEDAGLQRANLYKHWIARHPGHPVMHAVLFNHGVLLSELGDPAGAVAALRAAIAEKPDFYPPHVNLGSLLEQMGLADQAVAHWLKLLDGMVKGEWQEGAFAPTGAAIAMANAANTT